MRIARVIVGFFAGAIGITVIFLLSELVQNLADTNFGRNPIPLVAIALVIMFLVSLSLTRWGHHSASDIAGSLFLMEVVTYVLVSLLVGGSFVPTQGVLITFAIAGLAIATPWLAGALLGVRRTQ